MKLFTALELYHGDLIALQSGVVVEMWRNKSFGRVKRAFLKEFPTPEEQEKVEFFYGVFSSWFYKGLPNKAHFQPNEIEFMHRVTNFFGTI